MLVLIELKFKLTIETKEKLSGRWDLHLLKAKRAYQEHSEASALSKSDFCIKVITLDLQQSLSTQVRSNNVVFINVNFGPILWAYMNAGTCTLHPFFLLVHHFILFSSLSL